MLSKVAFVALCVVSLSTTMQRYDKIFKYKTFSQKISKKMKPFFKCLKINNLQAKKNYNFFAPIKHPIKSTLKGQKRYKGIYIYNNKENA